MYDSRPEGAPRSLHAHEAAEPGRGRMADAPWAIPPAGWRDILWRTWRNIGRGRLGLVAGGITFYLLLAAFPALGAFVSVYGLFLNLATAERQLESLSAILPQDALRLIGHEMVRLAAQRHETLSAALVFSALASIWSANAGMKALFDGLNLAYGESEKRPWLRRSLATYGSTLISFLLLVSVSLLTVAAPVFLHALGLHGLHFWFTPALWLLGYLMAAAGFTIVYRHGPSRARAKWRWVVCGGAGAALFWLVGSIAFSAFLDNFAGFGATYGSLGAVIGFMLWLWFTTIVVLAGAELNAEIEHQTARDTTVGAERPLGERGAVVADSVGLAITAAHPGGGLDVGEVVRLLWSIQEVERHHHHPAAGVAGQSEMRTLPGVSTQLE